MSKKTNQPLLDELTDAQRNAVLDGADAVKELADFRRRTFDMWMRIARGIAPLCALAARASMARKARKHLLADNGYGTLNEGTVSRLLRMADLETAIRIWRDTLTANKRDSWNSPTSICNRCPPVRAAIAASNKAKPPRKPRKPHVESAIDTFLEHLHSLDTDNRRATIERILSPFDLQLAPITAKAKTKPAKKATTVKDALKWKDTGNASMTGEHHSYEAKIETGKYTITPADFMSLAGGGVTFAGYEIQFYPADYNYPKNKNNRRLKKGIKTAEQAKALAERDYEATRP
jgi:hypothetical protein